MNKIKNILSFLILFLSLAMVPAKGWASDGAYVIGDTPLELQWSSFILNNYNYACFYFVKDGGKCDITSWTISNNDNFNHTINNDYDWAAHKIESNYILYNKDKASYGAYANLFQYKINTNGSDIHNSKVVLLLSNDANLLSEKENLAGVTKMEFDLYTEAGLKTSAIQYGNKSASFSSADSTSILPTAATSTSVSLPDFNAKYLRWQLFDSETSTTPIAVSSFLSNDVYSAKTTDLIWYGGENIADDSQRAITFDFSSLSTEQNVENYVLKCFWATNDNDDAKIVTYNGATYILQEPTLDGEYTFKFVKQETLDAKPLTLATDNVDAAHTHAVNAIYKDNKLEVSLTDAISDILSDFGVSDKKDVSDFYMRWVLADKDGNVISTATTSNGAFALRKTSESNGYYTLLTNNGASLLPNGLNATFELPTGESWSSDMQVYCLLTNEISGHSAEYGVIMKEPTTFKSKVNVQLFSPDDYPFSHYEGIANKKGDWDIVNGHTYQKTHEWEYYYYVDGKEYTKQVLLKLPLQYYDGNGNNLEPRGYYRWYNYDTDKASTNLKVCSDTETKLKSKGNWGLFASNIGSNPVSKLVGVYYDTSNVTDSWEGETIACDVSRYVDGMDESRSYLLREPTLSVRYIFHILPKKKIADDIMAALCYHTDGDITYEDNKKVTFGYKDNQAETTLRLQLNDIARYSYYPLTDDGKAKNVYEKTIEESDFNKSNGYQSPTQVVWRIYDITKSNYCELTGTTRFLDLSIDAITKTSVKWKNAEGSDITTPSITKGSPIYVVAYLSNGYGGMCPVANFDVRFMDFHPMTQKQLLAAGLNNRTISYLDSHYSLATKPISFDDDDDEQTLSVPTSPNDNQDRLPSKWDRRAYGFVYRDLIDYDATGYNGIGHSPLHGDYGLYKTANVTGISGNKDSGTDNYVWWTDKKVYDRTYYMTNGSQYGHFLYVDASDESRQIAAADFKADLCTGMQMIFSAAIADMTQAKELPQVMFKLYGMDYDADGNVKSQKLLHSFSSGDFKNNIDNPQKGEWFQVYGKIVLQQESGVENYSDFRIVIDNYCQNTDGADYAVDDIRIYIEPAKVQVLQDKPICGGASTGAIKLKIRAIHETLNAITGHANDTKIYFRFMKEDGTPVEGTNENDPYYQTTQVNTENNSKQEFKSNKYGTVNIFDSEETCKKYTIDGIPMIETDNEGETYIVLSNRYYPLQMGKKYYVSVSTEDPSKGNADWGSPSEVCSVYSDWFELISQTPYISDTDGNVITTYKVPCEGDYTIKVKGNLTTVDSKNGGKVTLTGLKYDWYLDEIDSDHKLNSHACNEISIDKDKVSLGEEHKLYMKPVTGVEEDGYIKYTAEDGTIYLLCTEAIPVTLRVAKDGPRLNFGFNDVDYPFNNTDYEASLRIGLPQIKALKNKNGYLQIPLHSASYLNGATDAKLTFVDDSKQDSPASADVYVATTNDPLWNDPNATLLSTAIGTLRSNELATIVAGTQSTLDLKFADDVLDNFHEGYWYELRFVYEQRGESATTTNCPGESYLKLKIVPEYVTWRPTADNGMNANWNNDANWHRSSSSELYKDDYIEYNSYADNSVNAEAANKVNIATIDNYVPMKFTKVTVGNLKGLPFPDLGNVVYRQSNGIATKLTNGKGNEATSYIQYDIMAYWDESDTGKGLGKQAVWNGASYTVSDMVADHVGDMSCEKFYGNTCHQIYFKPQGELRDQCYLVYDKAWVEKELKPNTWYTMATPLQYIYAGDMYVPVTSDAKTNGRQTTEAFKDINFDDTKYSRSKYPVYQRAWEKSGVEEITPNGNYSASHYPEEVKTGDVDLAMGYWSHIYNKVDESYADNTSFNGFSIKAGNSLLQKNQSANALLRLPKEDKSYKYYDYENNASSGSTDVNKSDGHGKFLVAYNNDEKHLAPMTQSLNADGKSGFYLVANPYTCSISLKKFFEVNTGLAKQAWIVEGSDVKAIAEDDFDKNDFAIQPTQSFFVKKASQGADEVKFTSAMYVDRLITSGLQMASDYIKTVSITTQNAKGQTSKARISLRAEASEGYDEQEDVDMLYDQNLQDIPQVYTVADGLAVAVNAVPAISWIPLGIVTDKAEGKEAVTLSIDGAGKLSEPLYLYDAADMSYTELHDGEAVNVEAGDHGRYFLTQTRGTTGIGRIDADEAQNLVKVYSPDAGMIVVSAVGGETLQQVNVFTMDGKMVHSYQLPGKQRMILRVPSGVYIVKASTAKVASPRGMKITVR